VIAAVTAGGTLPDAVTAMYDRQLTLLETDVMSLARAVRPDQFDFVPPGDGFTGVRSFGEQIRHLATTLTIAAARILEAEPPQQPGRHNNGPAGLHSRDDILAYLEASFAYARKAVTALNAGNHLETVGSVFGPSSRGSIAIGMTCHGYNHYGQMVVYARMNGIVPPGSVPTGDEHQVSG
jgi:hypothetical protein